VVSVRPSRFLRSASPLPSTRHQLSWSSLNHDRCTFGMKLKLVSSSHHITSQRIASTTNCKTQRTFRLLLNCISHRLIPFHRITSHSNRTNCANIASANETSSLGSDILNQRPSTQHTCTTEHKHQVCTSTIDFLRIIPNTSQSHFPSAPLLIARTLSQLTSPPQSPQSLQSPSQP